MSYDMGIGQRLTTDPSMAELAEVTRAARVYVEAKLELLAFSGSTLIGAARKEYAEKAQNAEIAWCQLVALLNRPSGVRIA